jgi:hypothetical protein
VQKTLKLIILDSQMTKEEDKLAAKQCDSSEGPVISHVGLNMDAVLLSHL